MLRSLILLHTNNKRLNYYRPPTKLWEGNVSSLVYLSVCMFRGRPHVTTEDLFKLVQLGKWAFG